MQARKCWHGDSFLGVPGVSGIPLSDTTSTIVSTPGAAKVLTSKILTTMNLSDKLGQIYKCPVQNRKFKASWLILVCSLVISSMELFLEDPSHVLLHLNIGLLFLDWWMPFSSTAIAFTIVVIVGVANNFAVTVIITIAVILVVTIATITVVAAISIVTLW